MYVKFTGEIYYPTRMPKSGRSSSSNSEKFVFIPNDYIGNAVSSFYDRIAHC